MDLYISQAMNIVLGSSLTLKTILIFMFSLLEGLPIVGSFFPGGTISLLVGVASEKNIINPLYAILTLTIGGFFGDMIGFFVGKKFKNTRLIQKIIKNEKHQKKWEFFDRKIFYISMLGRITPFVRSLPSLFAGARNIKTKKYMVISLLGSFVWSIGGVYGGNILSKITGKFSIPIILGILFVTSTIALYKHLFKK